MLSGDRHSLLIALFVIWCLGLVPGMASAQEPSLATLTDAERAWLQAHDGPCALVPVVVPTDDRRDYALFTTPYIEIPTVIVGTGSLGRGLTLDDLEGLKVAVVRDYVSEAHVRQASNGRFEVVTVESADEGLHAVALGQVDAYVESLANASYLIASHGMTNLQIAGETDLEFSLCIGVSRRHPLLHSAIQKALDDIGPDELAAIRSRWITMDTPGGLSPEIRRLLQIGGGVLVLLVVVLVIASVVLRRQLDRRTAAARASETRFRALFDLAPVPLIEMDESGRNQAMNAAARDSLGYTMRDLPDLSTWWRVAYPDPDRRRDAQVRWADAAAAAARGDGIVQPQEFTIHPPGRERQRLSHRRQHDRRPLRHLPRRYRRAQADDRRARRQPAALSRPLRSGAVLLRHHRFRGAPPAGQRLLLPVDRSDSR